MKLEDQQQRFEKNWEKQRPLFGTKSWAKDPNFLFFIEIPLPLELRTEMEQISQELAACVKQKGLWVSPAKMRITVALPGRMGVHFQGNEEGFMKKKLEALTQEFPPFELSLGDVNCFPEVLFREVYDEGRHLLRLHQRISEEIPFAQNPEFQHEHFLPHISLFYGEGNPALFDHPAFARKRKPTKMKVDRLFFGKARDDKEEYEKHILEEFKFLS